MRERNKDEQRLFHIVKYCEKLRAIALSMKSSYNNFIAKENYEKIDVSAFYIGQIGELSHGLSDEFKVTHTDIPWKQIVDMRNTLIHRYGTRDTHIIWDVIVDDIPVLNQKCRNILQLNNPEIADDIRKELSQETNIYEENDVEENYIELKDRYDIFNESHSGDNIQNESIREVWQKYLPQVAGIVMKIATNRSREEAFIHEMRKRLREKGYPDADVNQALREGIDGNSWSGGAPPLPPR